MRPSLGLSSRAIVRSLILALGTSFFIISARSTASWRVNAYQSYYEIEVDDGLTSYSELNIHTIRQRSFSYGVPLSIGLDFPLPGPWFVGVEARGAFFFNLDDALSASVRVGRYF